MDAPAYNNSDQLVAAAGGQCHVPDMDPRCVHPDVYTLEDPIGVVTAIRDLSD